MCVVNLLDSEKLVVVKFLLLFSLYLTSVP